MNKTDLIRLRTEIVAKLADLEVTTANARSTIQASAEANPSVLQDESDSAKGELDLENAMRVHKHSIAQQQYLHRAIQRMESGSYGRCRDCDDDIGMRRLTAMPGAPLCIHCQEARECGLVPEPAQTKIINQMQNRWAA